MCMRLALCLQKFVFFSSKGLQKLAFATPVGVINVT